MTKAIKKFNKVVERILDGNNTVNGNRLTLYDMKELLYIQYDLNHTHKAETVNSNVKQVLEYCGFALEPKGIGWKVV